MRMIIIKVWKYTKKSNILIRYALTSLLELCYRACQLLIHLKKMIYTIKKLNYMRLKLKTIWLRHTLKKQQALPQKQIRVFAIFPNQSQSSLKNKLKINPFLACKMQFNTLLVSWQVKEKAIETVFGLEATKAHQTYL